MFKSLNITS